MRLRTFKGGVHPKEAKELARQKPLQKGPIPKKVIIPLIQHIGSPCEPIVKVGDVVRAGEIIGKSDKFVSANIHSSISGKVVGIKDSPHPVLGRCKAVIIESDGQDRYESISLSKGPLEVIREAGIVGLGGAAFPTHVKLSVPSNKKVEVLILNGVECEPYLCCDHRLMLERPKQIAEGAVIIMDIIKVSRCIIAIEANKMDAVETLNNALVNFRNSRYSFEVVPLEVKYPQGAEKQLIKALLDREVPSGGLPYDVGVVVQNVGTVCAIYEAIKLNKPLYERVVTVTGDILKEPKNVIVKIGTTFKELIEFCGGLTQKAKKIIAGGPMMGFAVFTMDDMPVIKGTSGILVLSDDESRQRPWSVCIRCGKCIDVCPARIMPAQLGICVEAENFVLASRYDPLDCIECGACSYVCPSSRPLVQWIKWAKLKLRAQG